MPDIRAFRGIRYDLGRVGPLSAVVAPPYDVIDADLQRRLYDASPYNVVRLELNAEGAADTETDNRYTRAASFLRDWTRDDVLVTDSARSLYVMEQVFTVEGREYTRRGVMARVRLEPFGKGKIFPHEETLSGPKADRLRLFLATHMNLSPVFGLYDDPRNEVMAELEKAVGRALPVEATDHLGVTTRMWAVSDQHAVSAVAGLLGPKDVFIADGHHRYETGLRYLDERVERGEAADDEAAARFVMMFLVSMSDPGLVILPTHRLVSGLPGVTADKVSSLIAEHFDIEEVGTGDGAMRETWETIEIDGGQGVLGLGTTADGIWSLARVKETSPAMASLAAAHSPTWRTLGVSVLHVLLLDHLLGPGLGARPSCKYVHLLDEVRQAQQAKACDLAVLVPPAGMEHVTEIAAGLEKMPPKSTYFYPKLLSGMVFNPLK